MQPYRKDTDGPYPSPRAQLRDSANRLEGSRNDASYFETYNPRDPALVDELIDFLRSPQRFSSLVSIIPEGARLARSPTQRKKARSFSVAPLRSNGESRRTGRHGLTCWPPSL